MEEHARKRLQPRKKLAKELMYQEIAFLLDEHGDAPHLLQEAFSDMEFRMKQFSSEALGHLNPVRFTV